jgi:hypothetical protein
MFPFSIENGVKGHPEKQKITFDKIEINPTLAADLFTMPAKADSTATASAAAADSSKTATTTTTTTTTAKKKTTKKTASKTATKP